MAASYWRILTRALPVVLAFAVHSGTVAAQRSKPPAASKPPAPTTAAAQAIPPSQILVAGIRVVGAGIGANGSELRAFNESSGTTVALAIRAPAGVGIVEIDDRASRIDAFADDHGQSLLEEGRLGPFPKVTDDGSAALIELQVKGRPAPGASSVTARGSLGMTLASGSKTQRISNVRLEPARTFKLGSATISVKEVTPADESTSVTLGLSRSVLKTIRDVRFFDAKGDAVESQRTGSGYINDAATIDVDVKTKETIVAVEFDVWQNVRQTKVPFEISAGLSLPTAVGAAAQSGTSGRSAEERPSATPVHPVATSSDSPRPSEARQTAPATAPAATDGAASATAVMKQMQTAASAGKARDLLAVIYPDDRVNFARAVAMIMPLTVMGHLDDQKAADKIQKDVDALFAKHKITAPLISDPAEIFKSTDVAAFMTDALAFLKAQFPKGKDFAEALPLAGGALQDLKVTGDSAAAKVGEDAITFTRVNGKWFLRVPATRGQ